ncbi:hypothetical protein PLESTB_000401500 [Pleodorina starrii]|uniref:Uncharacterized protein n=1 Tax=Pleodorina starrii TaxID=330485 RepID=A0A9W6BF79_9CHLO|nr:hypothetical protein PLESTM_001496900 [Pleodorina starrii]GLC50633.1 hypothetical protein PLESTB_000401500 [Pleodorina starrii]GLC75246.1 hypothetical protein PLESTF_001613000 [Pleodorina starrii]
MQHYRQEHLVYIGQQSEFGRVGGAGYDQQEVGPQADPLLRASLSSVRALRGSTAALGGRDLPNDNDLYERDALGCDFRERVRGAAEPPTQGFMAREPGTNPDGAYPDSGNRSSRCASSSGSSTSSGGRGTEDGGSGRGARPDGSRGTAESGLSSSRGGGGGGGGVLRGYAAANLEGLLEAAVADEEGPGPAAALAGLVHGTPVPQGTADAYPTQQQLLGFHREALQQQQHPQQLRRLQQEPYRQEDRVQHRAGAQQPPYDLWNDYGSRSQGSGQPPQPQPQRQQQHRLPSQQPLWRYAAGSPPPADGPRPGYDYWEQGSSAEQDQGQDQLQRGGFGAEPAAAAALPPHQTDTWPQPAEDQQQQQRWWGQQCAEGRWERPQPQHQEQQLQQLLPGQEQQRLQQQQPSQTARLQQHLHHHSQQHHHHQQLQLLSQQQQQEEQALEEQHRQQQQEWQYRQQVMQQHQQQQVHQGRAANTGAMRGAAAVSGAPHESPGLLARVLAAGRGRGSSTPPPQQQQPEPALPTQPRQHPDPDPPQADADREPQPQPQPQPRPQSRPSQPQLHCPQPAPVPLSSLRGPREGPAVQGRGGSQGGGAPAPTAGEFRPLPTQPQVAAPPPHSPEAQAPIAARGTQSYSGGSSAADPRVSFDSSVNRGGGGGGGSGGGGRHAPALVRVTAHTPDIADRPPAHPAPLSASTSVYGEYDGGGGASAAASAATRGGVYDPGGGRGGAGTYSGDIPTELPLRDRDGGEYGGAAIGVSYHLDTAPLSTGLGGVVRFSERQSAAGGGGAGAALRSGYGHLSGGGGGGGGGGALQSGYGHLSGGGGGGGGGGAQPAAHPAAAAPPPRPPLLHSAESLSGGGVSSPRRAGSRSPSGAMPAPGATSMRGAPAAVASGVGYAPRLGAAAPTGSGGGGSGGEQLAAAAAAAAAPARRPSSYDTASGIGGDECGVGGRRGYGGGSGGASAGATRAVLSTVGGTRGGGIGGAEAEPLPHSQQRDSIIAGDGVASAADRRGGGDGSGGGGGSAAARQRRSSAAELRQSLPPPPPPPPPLLLLLLRRLDLPAADLTRESLSELVAAMVEARRLTPALQAPPSARAGGDSGGGGGGGGEGGDGTAAVAQAASLRAWLRTALASYGGGGGGGGGGPAMHSAPRACLAAHSAWYLISATRAARLMPPLAQLAALLGSLLASAGHPGGGLLDEHLRDSLEHPLALRHAAHPRHPLRAHHCEVAATLLAAAATTTATATAAATAAVGPPPPPLAGFSRAQLLTLRRMVCDAIMATAPGELPRIAAAVTAAVRSSRGGRQEGVRQAPAPVTGDPGCTAGVACDAGFFAEVEVEAVEDPAVVAALLGGEGAEGEVFEQEEGYAALVVRLLVHVAVNLGHSMRPWALCRAMSDAAAEERDSGRRLGRQLLPLRSPGAAEEEDAATHPGVAGAAAAAAAAGAVAEAGLDVRQQALRELDLIRGSARPALRLLVFAMGGPREGEAEAAAGAVGVGVGGGAAGRGLAEGERVLGPGALRALFENLDQNELMWSLLSRE